MKEAQDHYGKSDVRSPWIEKNIQKMVGQIMRDARLQRPMPLSITMNPVALSHFIEFLRSQSAFYPNEDGSFSFLKIPVYVNKYLPTGTFTVEIIGDRRMLLSRKN